MLNIWYDNYCYVDDKRSAAGFPIRTMRIISSNYKLSYPQSCGDGMRRRVSREAKYLIHVRINIPDSNSSTCVFFVEVVDNEFTMTYKSFSGIPINVGVMGFLTDADRYILSAALHGIKRLINYETSHPFRTFI